MDEYTRTQLKNFVKESIPVTPQKTDLKNDDFPLNTGNFIIGNHNFIFSNSSMIIILAAVLFSVAFFW